MVTTVRNRDCLPHLSSEGEFIKPIPVAGDFSKGAVWYSELTPYERMHTHHTLASVRRHAHFKPFKGLIPQDELDFVLDASYDQDTEVFPDTVDVYLQKETKGVSTWRRLTNSKEVMPDLHAVGKKSKSAEESGKASSRYNDYHPVIIGGITEKEHPSHVKLMNSSHHSPQTNAGYSRQDTDGNIFQY